MRKLLALCTLIALSAVAACNRTMTSTEVSIIPRPVKIEIKAGNTLTLHSPLSVSYTKGDSVLKKAAEFYVKELGAMMVGWQISLTDNDKKGTINIERTDDWGFKEGYQIKIDEDEIEVKANDYSGAIYALQTIKQLLPEQAWSRSANFARVEVVLPQLEIMDYPRFGYRGMHLDCVRHFFQADSVKKYIDYLAIHKLNRFHWHLTDDQGWRMESKAYPLLTEKASLRIDRLDQDWDARQPINRAAGEKPTYGGFYTQAQIRDIVAYAAERGVQVIPEIEIPGHSSEVFTAYPELSCLGRPQEVTPGGYYPDSMATCYCAGNEQVFAFLENILDETIALFPDAPYIHIGGDEVDMRFWTACPKCQARMKTEGLKTTAQLQSYFMQRIERFVNSRGKNIIGWDEILEGGLSPNATVMSWRGIAGGIQAASQGHDVIMTPNSYLYFDYHQNTPQSEPKAMGGMVTTVRRVFDYEPIPQTLSPQESKHILGAQANLWTEFIEQFSHVERMVLPRMAALAEVVWSPKEGKEWNDFSQRLVAMGGRYTALGAAAHHGSHIVEMQTRYDTIKKIFIVDMISEIHGAQIFYTLDGTEPTCASSLYSQPIEINKTTTIKAIVAKDGKALSTLASERLIGMHRGIGAQITYGTPPDAAYLGDNGNKTLLDGITGTTQHNDGLMQGFNNRNFDVTIDLGTPTAIKTVSGSFLLSSGTWIYLPSELIVTVSNDKASWREFGRTGHSIDSRTTPLTRASMTIEGSTTARYVRLVGLNKPTPMGLPGGGTINWIFADEIFID